MRKLITKTHDKALVLSKVNSELWLELVDIPTGQAKILVHKRGFGHTEKTIRKGYENRPMHEIVALFERLKIPDSPMYKKNVNFT